MKHLLKSAIFVLAVVAASIGLSSRTYAHHSFVAEYDDSKPVKITGTVTKVEWQNPHIWYYVDTKEEGSVAHWAFSGGAPGQLMRRGITRDAIKVGMTVTVEGFRARDGSNNASGGRVTLPDGRSVFTTMPQTSNSEKK